MKYVNIDHVEHAIHHKQSIPFDHCVVDDFFFPEVADKLETEFMDYQSEKWLCYRNKIENKKVSNDWNHFPALTYAAFSELNSAKMIAALEKFTQVPLFCDHGLHGGGWHIHGNGGNLNPHLDYSIHPKMGLQRKVNIIVYLSKSLLPEHGGHLGLWEQDKTTQQPGKLIKEVEPRFNRAIIFDTTQNSWHGLSNPLNVPDNVFRKSLAIYYLCQPAVNAEPRGRALFAPREAQKNESSVLELIKLRSGVDTSVKVYVAETET